MVVSPTIPRDNVEPQLETLCTHCESGSVPPVEVVEFSPRETYSLGGHPPASKEIHLKVKFNCQLNLY